MKKIWILCLCLLLVVVGCGKKEKQEDLTEDTVYTWDEDYSIKSEQGTLAASLDFAGENKPAVLIIGGSGPSVINGPVNSYVKLAEELKANGISIVSYDKRGIAGSKDLVKSEEEITMDTLTQDAVELLKKMKNDGRFSKIYVIGHSQGALVGELAIKEVPVDGVISLVGAGRVLDELLIEQLEKNPNNTEKVLEEGKAILKTLKETGEAKEIPSYYEPLFRQSVQPMIVSWMSYDPAKVLKEVDVPVLLIQGAHDMQISMVDASLLQEAKPDAKLVILKKMSHVLKDTEKEGDLTIYQNEQAPISADLVKAIVEFIQ